ncbi:MAG: hypothetical protein BMS9Abin06_0411 [Gammaproteobacteria bacterium]|nr:MAG: hypothetical protein BMS9Abin06_0411 [Gammaproteobacteria bacterium]
MIEAALYILTGITLYAGAHHLLADTGDTTRRYPVSLGVMYLLLSGFALASALTYQAHSIATLLPAGKLAIALGILLWVSLIWFVAFRTAFRPLILLDVLTAAWIILLIKNGLSVNSLMYADTAPLTQMLPSGPTVSPWWTALELTMLVSLLYTLYASYKLFVAGKRQMALALGGGLSVLLLVAVSDHLVNSGITHIVYLAPFGFAGFLLVNSLYPLLAAYMKHRTAKEPAVVYNLTFNPQQATFHSDVADLQIPSQEDHAVQADTPQQPAAPARKAYTPTLYSVEENAEDVPVTKPQPVTDKDPVPEKPVSKAPAPESSPAADQDQETLNTISDNLIDIAVFATMAMNRFKRGDADPKALEMLCKKIRTQSIKTRRLAHQVSRPGGNRKG